MLIRGDAHPETISLMTQLFWNKLQSGTIAGSFEASLACEAIGETLN